MTSGGDAMEPALRGSATKGSFPPIIIEPSRRRLALGLEGVWSFRELLYFLVWRDLKVRYRQTLLGGAWIALQPLAATAIFAVVFGRLIRVPSDGVPYPLFAFAGLVPWNYFAGSVSRGGTSLLNNAALITKVYFPRVVVPMASVLNGLVDGGVAFAVLVGLTFYYGVPLGPGLLALPLFVALAAAAALGVSVWIAALGVRYRDVNHALPFLLQVWMYATPVVYPVSLLPERWRLVAALNPMVGVVEGFRWAILGTGKNPGLLVLVSLSVTICLLMSGLAFFRHVDRSTADII